MNNRGRIACCGAISQYDGVPSAHGPRGVPGLIVVKRLIMQGFIVMDYMDQSAAALADLQSWVASGKLKVQEDVIDGIENTPKAPDRAARRREPRQADGEGVGRPPSTVVPARSVGLPRRCAIVDVPGERGQVYRQSCNSRQRARHPTASPREEPGRAENSANARPAPAALSAPRPSSPSAPRASSRSAGPRRRTSARTAPQGRSKPACPRTP